MLAIEPGNEINVCLQNYVVIDIETTGISSESASVIELSAIRVIDGVVNESFSSIVNPKVEISEKVYKLTGISNDMVKDASDIQSVLGKFLCFIGDDGNEIVKHFYVEAMLDFSQFQVKYVGVSVEE